MSFRIYRDEYATTQRTTGSTVLPYISSISLPSAEIPGSGGGIAYDITSQRVYYSNGYTWLPIGSGGGGSTVDGYSLIKDTPSQSIPTSTPTIVTGWTCPPPYESSAEWNLATGIYTAAVAQSFSISAQVSWEAGSNLGIRYLRILFNGVSIKESSTQADPNKNIDTTQEVTISLSLDPGDTVSVQVEHNAPTSVSIGSGNRTSLCGLKIVT